MPKLPDDAIAEQIRNLDERVTSLVQSIKGRVSTGPILILTLINTGILIWLFAYTWGAGS